MEQAELARTVKRLRVLSARIDGLERNAETIRAEIRAHMGSAEEERVGEYTIHYKTVTGTRLDLDALREAAPGIVAQYSKEYTTRPLRIT